MSLQAVVDDAPLSGFHKKLTVYSSGGPFLDGYVLSIIGVALTQIVPQMHLNALWDGLIGASALGGVFLGGLVFGYVTDIFGRQVMYTLDLVIFIVASVLQIFVHGAVELFVLRLILGIAIGADYPIATSLLAEFAPKKQRGPMLGSLLVSWYVGATAAYVVGYFLMSAGPDAWRWMLGTSALPALVILLLRLGTPESPRWLVSKNRVKEAEKVLKKVYGPDADLTQLSEPIVSTKFFKLFQKGYLKRTMFVGLFWMFSIIPAFGIYTFGPEILNLFHLGSGNAGNLGSAALDFIFLIGCIPALYLCNSIGRRALLNWCFVFMAVGLLILGVFPNAPVWVIILGFVVYALFSGGPNVLDFIYPNEIFPTEIRASAVGVATAMSRVGAFVGTFLMPLSLSKLGVGTTMILGTIVTVLGLLVSLMWAPETKDRNLTETSSIDEKDKGSAKVKGVVRS
jgi:putative MFS transporter